jgi:hypothetical protein
MSFAAPALFHTEGLGEFHLTKSGSVTKVFYRGRYFALATYHQFRLGGYNFDQLVLGSLDHRTVHTCNKVVFPQGGPETLDDYDCLLFDFSMAVSSGALHSSGWFDLSHDMNIGMVPKPLCVCSVGYPGEHNSFEYDPPTYAAKALPIFGRECEPLMAGRLSFRPIADLSFDPKGISGCPVFGICEENEGLRANFAGIVTSGTRTALNFISLSRIRRLLLIV